MRASVCLIVLALVAGWSAPLRAQLARNTAIAKAETILKNLQDGRTADIVAEFDARLSKELPEPAEAGVAGPRGAIRRVPEHHRAPEGPMQELRPSS